MLLAAPAEPIFASGSPLWNLLSALLGGLIAAVVALAVERQRAKGDDQREYRAAVRETVVVAIRASDSFVNAVQAERMHHGLHNSMDSDEGRDDAASWRAAVMHRNSSAERLSALAAEVRATASPALGEAMRHLAEVAWILDPGAEFEFDARVLAAVRDANPDHTQDAVEAIALRRVALDRQAEIERIAREILEIPSPL